MRLDELISAGALFVINHSGGKDSQAMMIRLLDQIPRDQIVVVHASLGDIEWPGALELARDQAAAAGVPFIVAKAVKTFLQMVERRFETRPDVPSWPSAATRQCTSDLKRGPIAREIRGFAKTHGRSIIVSCVGLRAAESASRAKQPVWKRNERESVAGRQWFDWLPIHELSTADVFATIAAAGQSPHPAYAAGNQRLSCLFCIMASRRDLKNAAKHHPEIYQRYLDLERRTGYTMHQSRVPLDQIVGAAA